MASLKKQLHQKIEILLNLLLKIKVSPFTYLVRSLYVAIALFGMLKCFAPHPIDLHLHLGRRMNYGKHLFTLTEYLLHTKYCYNGTFINLFNHHCETLGYLQVNKQR